MTVVIWSRGDLEGVPVYQDFDEVVGRVANAYSRGIEFVIIEKTDTNRVAFSLSNLQRIEEID